MVIKTRTLLMALLALALAFLVLWVLPQSEERRVKNQFHALAEALSKKKGESLLTMDQKIKKIASFFDETCDLTLQAYSISGQLSREEIIGYAARSRLHLSELQLKFYDFRITFHGQEEARVSLTARLTGRMTTGESLNEAHEIECLLKKAEKRWLLTRVEVVEVLKR